MEVFVFPNASRGLSGVPNFPVEQENPVKSCPGSDQ